ncbi:hypothetical protein [Acidithiobacillus sp.]|uniref:hypothetical protein n=1 Tax=Acidithiobacillus sp. TaxID=1872118 RepID=UPI0025C6FF15|nr:hypothetical protein [Acidithiobacillus sp.]
MSVVAPAQDRGLSGRRQFLRWLSGAAFCAAATSPAVALGTGEAPSEIFRRRGAARAALLRRYWQESSGLASVRTGPPTGLRMMQFIDPLCPLFSRQWWALWPHRDRLCVHWIPVAFVRPESLGVAAHILASPHPVTALEKAALAVGTQSSLLAAAPPIPERDRVPVRGNTRFWRERLGVLPVLLYPHRQGPHAFVGVAEPQILATILRLANDRRQGPATAPVLPDFQPRHASP